MPFETQKLRSLTTKEHLNRVSAVTELSKQIDKSAQKILIEVDLHATAKQLVEANPPQREWQQKRSPRGLRLPIEWGNPAISPQYTRTL